jgi:hypothetical protein
VCSSDLGPAFDETAARRLLHAAGAETFADALILAHVRGRIGRARVAPLLDLPRRWAIPRLPIGGRDLAAVGIAGGPEVGRLLAEAEAAWVESDFGLDREALLERITRQNGR